MLSPIQDFSTKEIDAMLEYHCSSVHFDRLGDRKGWGASAGGKLS